VCVGKKQRMRWKSVNGSGRAARRRVLREGAEMLIEDIGERRARCHASRQSATDGDA
jgi:hypothetical protein